MDENFIVVRNDTYYSNWTTQKLVEQAYQIVGSEVIFMRERILVDDFSNDSDTSANSSQSDVLNFKELTIDPNPVYPLTTLTLLNTSFNGTYAVKEWVYRQLDDANLMN